MTKRLRHASFLNPKKIEDAAWETIYRMCHIPSEDQRGVKRRLDDLVDTFATWMTNERKQPDQTTERERIEEAHSHIHIALATIDKLGPAGRMAFRAVSPFLAPMLAAQWMNESFPNDDRTPHKSYAPAESSGWREPLRQNIRAPEYFIEEHTLEARYQFVRCAPVETTGTALKQIEKGVRNALRAFDDLRPKSEGGPKPLKFRHYMIVNLIEIWDGIGKTPSSGPNSPCTTFCELVVDAMGWPTAGLGSAMPRAIKFWRNWAEKSASEANTLARN